MKQKYTLIDDLMLLTSTVPLQPDFFADLAQAQPSASVIPKDPKPAAEPDLTGDAFQVEPVDPAPGIPDNVVITGLSKEQSGQLQEMAFQLGYKWFSESTAVKYTGWGTILLSKKGCNPLHADVKHGLISLLRAGSGTLLISDITTILTDEEEFTAEQAGKTAILYADAALVTFRKVLGLMGLTPEEEHAAPLIPDNVVVTGLSEEQNEELQEMALALGYRWSHGIKTPKYLDWGTILLSKKGCHPHVDSQHGVLTLMSCGQTARHISEIVSSLVHVESFTGEQAAQVIIWSPGTALAEFRKELELRGLVVPEKELQGEGAPEIPCVFFVGGFLPFQANILVDTARKKGYTCANSYGDDSIYDVFIFTRHGYIYNSEKVALGPMVTGVVTEGAACTPKEYVEQLLSPDKRRLLVQLTYDEALAALNGGTHVQTPEQLPRVTSRDPVLLDGMPQKVRALVQLVRQVSGFDRPVVPSFVVIRPEEVVAEKDKSFDIIKGHQLFVRPCPFTPNHGAKVAGFESELVERKDVVSHIHKVQKAMLEHAPDASILVMPYIKASLSSVVAPRQYAMVGEGHDGITAGTSASMVIPMDADESVAWIQHAGEDPSKVELEFVYGRDWSGDRASRLVQLRRAAEHVAIGAPPTKDALPGFVPGGTVQVERIYVVKDLDDLGELEVLKTMDTHGLLVVQPSGNLCSHASAHCRGAAIPFVVDAAWSEEAYVGRALYDAGGWVSREPVEGVSYKPADYEEEFWLGCELARTGWMQEWGKLSTFFHQYVGRPMGDPGQVAFLGGVFAGWLVMAGLAACLGEMRHSARCMVHLGTWRKAAGTAHAFLLNSLGCKPMQVSREDVYKGTQRYAPTWDEVFRAADLARVTFGDYKWSGSYGGEKWAKCARLVRILSRAIEKRELWRVLSWANRLENAVHNGGHLFDKYLEKDYFDSGTRGFRVKKMDLVFGVAEVAFGLPREGGRPETPLHWSEVIEKAKASPLNVDDFSEESEEEEDWDDEEDNEEEEEGAFIIPVKAKKPKKDIDSYGRATVEEEEEA